MDTLTPPYIKADGESVPFTLGNARSDCCNSRAYFKATLHTGGSLYFCNHHFYIHKNALQDASLTIQDESLSLKN